ncbi:hypothetical protein [Maribacter sp. 2307ULW6-5]|uniref:hypothetical protein n=1 Tax=Maribacter sp. 2307ULW6-5 TaxID=3386275 RepID=UPI0039BCCF13
MKKIFPLLLCVLALVMGCRKKSPPKPPEAVQLVFPERNSECTEGQRLGANTTEVEFRWQAAEHTDTYELRVTNTNTNTVQTINTQSTSAKLPLTRGEPFSWFVRSRNAQVTETASSATWHFYNQGSTTTFAPFPAGIESPEMSERVFADINNEVLLTWTTADLDNDIANVQVFLSTETTAGTLLRELPARAVSLKVDVASGTVYYWRVVVTDREGNVSDSGIYSFRVM